MKKSIKVQTLDINIFKVNESEDKSFPASGPIISLTKKHKKIIQAVSISEKKVDRIDFELAQFSRRKLQIRKNFDLMQVRSSVSI